MRTKTCCLPWLIFVIPGQFGLFRMAWPHIFRKKNEHFRCLDRTYQNGKSMTRDELICTDKCVKKVSKMALVLSSKTDFPSLWIFTCQLVRWWWNRISVWKSCARINNIYCIFSMIFEPVWYFRMNEAQIEQEVMVELYERMITSCHNKCIGRFRSKTFKNLHLNFSSKVHRSGFK